ncbi:thioredoxin family protein [Marimonas lutisalis]|uniref:thioredoxin family protein n=1 Tax=Marimonas lutisalis TaxID=2545756 RepID=UPI0010F4B4A4|nr:thioredoxin family protein [Marimonas lutisalis]
MKRREFMAVGAAALIVPGALRAKPLTYVPGLVDERLAAGEILFLDFKASWCGTCKAQERVLNRLKAANPDYEKNITFINIDWDEHGRGELVKRMNIPRRSTLVVLRGDQELGRIVAGTGEAEIKELMDTALSAAMA